MIIDHGRVKLRARVKVEKSGRPEVSGQSWRLGRE